MLYVKYVKKNSYINININSILFIIFYFSNGYIGNFSRKKIEQDIQ